MSSTISKISVNANGKHLYYIKLVDGKPIKKDEFCCKDCNLVQDKNWCFKCDTYNSCYECEGHGGDDITEGNQEWICRNCFEELNCEYYKVDDPENPDVDYFNTKEEAKNFCDKHNISYECITLEYNYGV